MLDLDEMLLSIKNTQVKKYLDESIKSYKVGNHRSAIITSWIAAMFDLVEKFQILVRDREETAIQQWNNIKPLIKDHKNWETKLLQAAKPAAMISQYEFDSLENLRKIRNKYAHPSFDEIGTLFDPTPEEVRYFIRTLFDLVLSQPAQLGAFYVNKLLEQIKNPSFFAAKPDLDNLSSSKDLVRDKFNKIHPKQVKRLLREFVDVLRHPESDEHKLNTLCFVINLWGYSDEWQINEDIASYLDIIIDETLDIHTLRAIMNYPESINRLSDISKMRIEEVFKNVIIRNLEYSKNRCLAKRFFAVSDILPIAQSILNDINSIFPDNQIKGNYQLENHLYTVLHDKFIPKFGRIVLKHTREKLQTCNGYIVNPAVETMRQFGFWEIANLLIIEEKKNFAHELIESLTSNNWATMTLLNYSNQENISIDWIEIILESWLVEILNGELQPYTIISYIEQFSALNYRYNKHYGNFHNKLSDALEKLTSDELNNIDALSSFKISKLDEDLRGFWRHIFDNFNKIFFDDPNFKAMFDNWQPSSN